MLLSHVLPVFLQSGRGRDSNFCVSDNYCNLHSPKKDRLLLVTSSWREELSSACYQSAPWPKVHGGFWQFRCRGDFGLRIRAQAKLPTGEEEEGDGDKDVQDLLVDLLRLETGKVRVNEFVEDRSKFLTEIAEQANEEFDRIAEEARKSMDEAGSKVLEQIDAEAADFEEELAAARAEMEANEREFDEFEKNVEKARSEGLFFKTLFTKPTKPWKAKSLEEQQEIKEKAKAVTDALDLGTKKAAGSKVRRSAYVIMIILLTFSVLEAVSSENVQWPKLVVSILLLAGLVVQFTYETLVYRDRKEDKSK